VSWNVMLAVKRARPSSRYVMGCHVLHAVGAYAADVSGMGPCSSPSLNSARPCPVARPLALSRPLLEAGAAILFCGRVRLVEAASVRLPHVVSSIPFRSTSFRSSRRRVERGEHYEWRRWRRRRLTPCGGTLIRGRARARVGAGAVRAPDCARETPGARLPSAPQGQFHAGANRNGLRMPLLSSAPYLAVRHRYVKPIIRIISDKMNKHRFSAVAHAALPGRRRRQGCGGRLRDSAGRAGGL